jgi:hypothetical protein
LIANIGNDCELECPIACDVTAHPVSLSYTDVTAEQVLSAMSQKKMEDLKTRYDDATQLRHRVNPSTMADTINALRNLSLVFRKAYYELSVKTWRHQTSVIKLVVDSLTAFLNKSTEDLKPTLDKFIDSRDSVPFYEMEELSWRNEFIAAAGWQRRIEYSYDYICLGKTPHEYASSMTVAEMGRVLTVDLALPFENVRKGSQRNYAMTADPAKQRKVAVDGYQASQELKQCATKYSNDSGTWWDLEHLCATRTQFCYESFWMVNHAVYTAIEIATEHSDSMEATLEWCSEILGINELLRSTIQEIKIFYEDGYEKPLNLLDELDGYLIKFLSSQANHLELSKALEKSLFLERLKQVNKDFMHGLKMNINYTKEALDSSENLHYDRYWKTLSLSFGVHPWDWEGFYQTHTRNWNIWRQPKLVVTQKSLVEFPSY